MLLTLSCSILLELVQQVETAQKPNLAKAIEETLNKNLIKIVPLALIWATIWFILVVIEAFLRRKERNREDEYTPENVARTLSGADTASWWRISFDLLHKGIRMIVFLIMPAFAWENLSFYKSMKKGILVLRSHLMEFGTRFTITYVAAAVLFLPVAIAFMIRKYTGFVFPDWFWLLVIIYIGFAWSYSMYLEQMFMADMYLWHMKWEEACKRAKKKGEELPWGLWAVPKPSIIDEVPDLLRNYKKPRKSVVSS